MTRRTGGLAALGLAMLALTGCGAQPDVGEMADLVADYVALMGGEAEVALASEDEKVAEILLSDDVTDAARIFVRGDACRAVTCLVVIRQEEGVDRAVVEYMNAITETGRTYLRDGATVTLDLNLTPSAESGIADLLKVERP